MMMIDPFKIINKWRQKNDTAVPRNLDEERLVTSRRAFLGLLGGAAAVAVTHSPAFQTLEVLANEAPALQPFDPIEGYLQMRTPDRGWVSLGSLQEIRLPPAPEFDVIDFGIMDGPHRIQRMVAPRPSTFSLRATDDFPAIHNELMTWMDSGMNAGFNRSPARDYKRELRCKCLGITWEVEGAFLTRLDSEMQMPDPKTNEFGQVLFDIEFYSGTTRIVADVEKEFGGYNSPTLIS